MSSTPPHPAASTGSFATRRSARRSAIGTACAARAACRRGWTSTPACCARICRTPPSSRSRAQAACASGWVARGSTRFWAWMCGACRFVRCSTCRNGPGSRTEVEEAIAATRDLLILDVVSPAPRFGRPEDESAARSDRDPADDRCRSRARPARSTSWAPLSGEPRKADAPHRWCVPEIRELPLRAGEPVLRDAPPQPRRAPSARPAWDHGRDCLRGRAARWPAPGSG
jgi:hypothetical protein